jgi:HSP20 family protein
MTTTLSKRQNGNSLSSVDNLINSVFHDGLQRIFTNTLWDEEVPVSSGNVPVNIRETHEQYQIDLVAPGCRKEDFKVTIAEKLLTVSFSPDDADKGTAKVAWTRNEFVLRPFSKNFIVDESVDVNNISASYQSGILRISLAKNEPAKSSIKQIEIK